MFDSWIHDVIEELAERLVLADLGDTRALGEVESMLRRLRDEAASASPEIAESAREAAAAVAAVASGAADDAGASLEGAGRAVSRMQAIVAGNGSPIATRREAAGATDIRPPLADDRAASGQSGVSATSFAADAELLGDFVTRASELLDAADVQLLVIESAPRDEEALNSVFRAFHTIKGMAGFLELDAIQAMAHEAEGLLGLARSGQLVFSGPTVDVAFSSVDAMRALVAGVGDADCEKAAERDRYVDSVVTRIRDAMTGGSFPEGIGDAGATPSSVALKGPAEERPAVRPAARATLVKEAVRVDAERLDQLLDAIGELVIAESMVTRSPEFVAGSSARLVQNLGRLDSLTRQLQEIAGSLRMVPLRPTFARMARVVRDLAVKAGKDIEFVVSGEDTELDKAVVERIEDPLLHLVRNAVDHGIEAVPGDRVKSSKPATGRVALRAFHKAGCIHIEVEDDGHGLDTEAIIAKARASGVMGADDVPSERELESLLFMPGFSTSEVVNEVSGRGVGMDVVKRAVDALQGQISVRSEAGSGCVVSMRLPLTLAVMDGMVIRAGEERYIVPTLSIVRSLRPVPSQVSTVLGRGEMVRISDELVRVVRLSSALGSPGAGDGLLTESIVMVVEDDGGRAGLVVDEILGQQQIVIKPLGEALRGVAGVSGGAVMPDGRVGLILDISGLIRLANEVTAER
jgi:two-component system chemotaxis sensor kinase CheA